MENYVPVVSYAGRPDTILEQILIYVFPSYCIVSIICLLSLTPSIRKQKNVNYITGIIIIYSIFCFTRAHHHENSTHYTPHMVIQLSLSILYKSIERIQQLNPHKSGVVSNRIPGASILIGINGYSINAALGNVVDMHLSFYGFLRYLQRLHKAENVAKT